MIVYVPMVLRRWSALELRSPLNVEVRLEEPPDSPGCLIAFRDEASARALSTDVLVLSMPDDTQEGAR